MRVRGEVTGAVCTLVCSCRSFSKLPLPTPMTMKLTGRSADEATRSAKSAWSRGLPHATMQTTVYARASRARTASTIARAAGVKLRGSNSCTLRIALRYASSSAAGFSHPLAFVSRSSGKQLEKPEPSRLPPKPKPVIGARENGCSACATCRTALRYALLAPASSECSDDASFGSPFPAVKSSANDTSRPRCCSASLMPGRRRRARLNSTSPSAFPSAFTNATRPLSSRSAALKVDDAITVSTSADATLPCRRAGAPPPPPPPPPAAAAVAAANGGDGDSLRQTQSSSVEEKVAEAGPAGRVGLPGGSARRMERGTRATGHVEGAPSARSACVSRKLHHSLCACASSARSRSVSGLPPSTHCTAKYESDGSFTSGCVDGFGSRTTANGGDTHVVSKVTTPLGGASTRSPYTMPALLPTHHRRFQFLNSDAFFPVEYFSSGPHTHSHTSGLRATCTPFFRTLKYVAPGSCGTPPPRVPTPLSHSSPAVSRRSSTSMVRRPFSRVVFSVHSSGTSSGAPGAAVPSSAAMPTCAVASRSAPSTTAKARPRRPSRYSSAGRGSSSQPHVTPRRTEVVPTSTSPVPAARMAASTGSREAESSAEAEGVGEGEAAAEVVVVVVAVVEAVPNGSRTSVTSMWISGSPRAEKMSRLLQRSRRLATVGAVILLLFLYSGVKAEK
eukprot:Rhum_TRINITY_DN10305_c0_g1::Rhum_TRINITY_DN10305_c0_g1_i1::g.37815::m.37815